MFVSRPILGPSVVRTTEPLFDALARGGITGESVTEASDARVLVTMGSIANDLPCPPDVRRRMLGHLPVTDTPRLVEQTGVYDHSDGAARYRRVVERLLVGTERDARCHASSIVRRAEPSSATITPLACKAPAVGVDAQAEALTLGR